VYDNTIGPVYSWYLFHVEIVKIGDGKAKQDEA
jgi:hypothetical protein